MKWYLQWICILSKTLPLLSNYTLWTTTVYKTLSSTKANSHLPPRFLDTHSFKSPFVTSCTMFTNLIWIRERNMTEKLSITITKYFLNELRPSSQSTYLNGLHFKSIPRSTHAEHVQICLQRLADSTASSVLLNRQLRGFSFTFGNKEESHWAKFKLYAEWVARNLTVDISMYCHGGWEDFRELVYGRISQILLRTSSNCNIPTGIYNRFVFKRNGSHTSVYLEESGHHSPADAAWILHIQSRFLNWKDPNRWLTIPSSIVLVNPACVTCHDVCHTSRGRTHKFSDHVAPPLHASFPLLFWLRMRNPGNKRFHMEMLVKEVCNQGNAAVSFVNPSEACCQQLLYFHQWWRSQPTRSRLAF